MIEVDNIYNTNSAFLLTDMINQGLKVDCISTVVSASKFSETSYELFNLYDKVLVKNGSILYNFKTDMENPDFMWQLIADIIKYTDFRVADCIVCKRNRVPGFVTVPNELLHSCEFTLVISRKSEYFTFYMNKAIKSFSKIGQAFYECYLNLFDIDNQDSDETYCLDAAKQLLSFYTPPHGLVLDPQMGTGVTPMAAALTGRHYIGAEVNKSTYDFAYSYLSQAPKVIRVENAAPVIFCGSK